MASVKTYEDIGKLLARSADYGEALRAWGFDAAASIDYDRGELILIIRRRGKLTPKQLEARR